MDVTLETDADLYNKQIALEADMLTGGIQRFRKAKDKAIESGRESTTKHGRAIVANLVGSVAKGLQEWLDNPSNKSRDIAWKKVNSMDVEQVAYLSLVTLVDSLSRKNTLMHVARTIGSNVEIQDRLDQWIEAEGNLAHNVIKEAMKKSYGARRYGLTHKMNKDGYKYTEWENSERVHVGFKMVDIIIQTTGLVKLDTQQEQKRKRATYVVPTDGTTQWVQNFNVWKETMHPRFAPCIYEPKDWTGVKGGGYHGHIIDELPIVRRR